MRLGPAPEDPEAGHACFSCSFRSKQEELAPLGNGGAGTSTLKGYSITGGFGSGEAS